MRTPGSSNSLEKNFFLVINNHVNGVLHVAVRVQQSLNHFATAKRRSPIRLFPLWQRRCNAIFLQKKHLVSMSNADVHRTLLNIPCPE